LAGRRDQIVLASKFGFQDFDMGDGAAAGAKGGRAYIRRAVERSLHGLLTGKVRKGQPPPAGTRLAGRPGYVTEAKLDRVEALISWAGQRGVTVLEVAIGALAAQPRCASVIAGATSPEQVKGTAAAADWVPSPGELAELDQLVPPPGAG